MKCKFCGTEYKGSYCPNCGSNNPNFENEQVIEEKEEELEPEVEITKEKKDHSDE